MKTVVITGASTGIGRVTAEHLATRGWRVFACVRKPEDGADLQAANATIETLLVDVTDSDQVSAAVAAVDTALAGAKLDGLINNAGIAIMGPLPIQDLKTVRAHFDVNVFGLLTATQAFLPLLGTDTERTGKPGRIINISSLGGQLASPFLGAYTATKHAVESITDSFRRELPMFGIDAISVGPGAVRTPIWDKADESGQTHPYNDTPWAHSIGLFSRTMVDSGRDGLRPETVARVIEKALTAKKPKARYNPVRNKFFLFTLPLLAPKRAVDRVFWKRFELLGEKK
ncbi:MAG: SDR family oxidoreductase [Pseudomonadota bacterium]